jgi:hypothetical protein
MVEQLDHPAAQLHFPLPEKMLQPPIVLCHQKGSYQMLAAISLGSAAAAGSTAPQIKADGSDRGGGDIVARLLSHPHGSSHAAPPVELLAFFKQFDIRPEHSNGKHAAPPIKRLVTITSALVRLFPAALPQFSSKNCVFIPAAVAYYQRTTNRQTVENAQTKAFRPRNAGFHAWRMKLMWM